MLLWLLDGVEHRNFSGLFLRRTFAQLEGSPTSPIDFSFSLFPDHGGKPTMGGKIWKWPNGATIRFGHMQYEDSKFNYQGPAFHRVVFDELTQFTRTQFDYMFSRLRREAYFPIPVGVRASTNPAHNWVKTDCISLEAQSAIKQLGVYDPTPAGMIFDCPGLDGRFLPARVADNPYYDTKEYVDRLRKRLGGMLAAQLASGDWSAIEGAVVDAENLRYYTMRGEIIVPMIELKSPIMRDSRLMKRFATIDTAGTSKQKAKEARGKEPSWSVCAIWEHWPEVGLFLRHVWREQVGWPQLKNKLKAVLHEWGNPTAHIENAHFGQVLHAEIKGSKLISAKLPGMGGGQEIDGAKYDRAVASGLLKMIEDGQFWLPDVGTVAGASSWMPEYESELLGWTGHPDETADQIDVSSNGAYHVKTGTASWGGPVGNTKRVGARF